MRPTEVERQRSEATSQAQAEQIERKIQTEAEAHLPGAQIPAEALVTISPEAQRDIDAWMRGESIAGIG